MTLVGSMLYLPATCRCLRHAQAYVWAAELMLHCLSMYVAKELNFMAHPFPASFILILFPPHLQTRIFEGIIELLHIKYCHQIRGWDMRRIIYFQVTIPARFPNVWNWDTMYPYLDIALDSKVSDTILITCLWCKIIPYRQLSSHNHRQDWLKVRTKTQYFLSTECSVK